MGCTARRVRLIGGLWVGLVAVAVAVLWSPPGPIPGATVAAAEPSPPYAFVYHFTQSAKRWLPGPALPHFARATVPTGTTFSYTASITFGVGLHLEANFDFWRITTGRRVGKRCVAATNANRRRAHCARRIGVGRLSHSAREGRNTLRFAGRMNRTKTLAPGHYEVELFLSTSDLGNSDSEFLRFTVLRPAGGLG